MKTIGLLGGTAWYSTISYYTLLNETMHKRLGGHHSAKILLKSIDFHDMVSQFGKDHDKVAELLKRELLELIALRPDCLIICCSSLHKYYDIIKDQIPSRIPVMHAVDLVANHLKSHYYKKVLLLATKFTMDDGFFAERLAQDGIEVVVPTPEQRLKIQEFDQDLIRNHPDKGKAYFKSLIAEHKDLDAVILGCTEFPLLIQQEDSPVPLVNPVELQVACAVDYALDYAQL